MQELIDIDTHCASCRFATFQQGEGVGICDHPVAVAERTYTPMVISRAFDHHIHRTFSAVEGTPAPQCQVHEPVET
jgi:hypothetical protein